VASLWVFTAVADYGQVDSTIIPMGCVEDVRVVQNGVLDLERVKLCMSAFLQGRCYHYLRRFQFRKRTFEAAKHIAEST
jgi:hypothetical protein